MLGLIELQVESDLEDYVRLQGDLGAVLGERFAALSRRHTFQPGELEAGTAKPPGAAAR